MSIFAVLLLSKGNRYECFYENRGYFAFVCTGYGVDIGYNIVVWCRAS